MSLKKYRVDVTALDKDERERIIDILERYSETGLSLTGKRDIYTFFMNDDTDPLEITGLPAEQIHHCP